MESTEVGVRHVVTYPSVSKCRNAHIDMTAPDNDMCLHHMTQLTYSTERIHPFRAKAQLCAAYRKAN